MVTDGTTDAFTVTVNEQFTVGEPVNQAGIETRVRGASSSPINLTDTSKVIVVATGDGSYCEGHAITVTVSFDHKIFMPFMARLLGRTPPNDIIPLSASVTDTILSPICP